MSIQPRIMRAEEEVAELREQLREAYETIEAIRHGGIDSLVIGPPGEERVYNLTGADRTYRLLVESMNEGAATLSGGGVILYANPRLVAMMGRTSTELAGSSALDLVAPEHRDSLARLLETGPGASARQELELKGSGASVQVVLSVSAFDLDGTLMRCLVATDLTALREAERALGRAEAKYRSIVDHAAEGIFQADLQGLIVVCNPALARMLGFDSPAELVASTLNIDTLFPEPTTQGEGLHRRLLETGSVTDLELQASGAGDRRIWVSLNCHTVPDDEGRPKWVEGTAVDVTARRAAQDELRQLAAELEQRVQLRTAELERSNHNLEAFSYSVSHDLRAPLRAMSGFADRLLSDYGDQLDSRGRDFAGRIKAASVRMSALIDDLLQLSRVSRVELNVEAVDLSQVARNVASDLQSIEPARTIVFDIKPGIVVQADRKLITTVIENLFGNAWKFTAPHGRARIELGAAGMAADFLDCFVRDDGVGFDPQYQSKLFQPFQRLHSREFEGTGIGLASVRRIVERHGGKTWAEGDIEKGATIHFTLPTKPPRTESV